MSTRSTIAILNNDGTVDSVYAHWDGYISGNGLILFQHYQDVSKIKKLISLGSISSLDNEVEPAEGVKHDFDNRAYEVTTFYGRDRGETDVEPQKFSSLQEYIKNGNFQEYDYVFDEQKNQWFVWNGKEMDDLETLIFQNPDISAETKIILKNEGTNQKLHEELPTKDSTTQTFKV